MFTSHIVLALAWAGYCILHSMLANTKVKQFFRDRLGDAFRFYRSFYLLTAGVLLVFLVKWQIGILTNWIWQPFWLQYPVGIVMVIAGLAGIAICLRKYFLSSAGFKDLVYEGGTPVLVINGIHRLVRHPLYLSTFIFIWGMLVYHPVWSLFVANLVITIYTLIGIGLEEKKLMAIFGDQYIRYREQVPMIWPGMKNKPVV